MHRAARRIRLRRITSLAAAVCFCVGASTGSAADDLPSSADIVAAIRDLGSAEFRTREQATQRLWKIGEPALPALAEARSSPVLEVGRRARWLVERIQAGVTPETPQPLVSLVRRWHMSIASRETVIKELIKQGETALPVLRGLRRYTPDVGLQEKLQSAIHDVIRTQVWSAIAADDLTTAESVLRQVRTDSAIMRHYATFFLLTGRIDHEIELVRADWEESQDVALGQLLMLCLRAAGRREEALRVGAQVDEPMWLDGLHVETGRWTELAVSQATWPSTAPQQVRPRMDLRTVRDQGFHAACLRLAGAPSDSERLLDHIIRTGRQALVQNKQPDFRDYATVLLVNQRPAEAVEILTAHARKSHLQRKLAFSLLCLRERHDTAFELAELPVPDASRKALMQAAYAKQLAGLGERDRAVALLAPPIAQAANDNTNSTRTLIKTLISIGEVSVGLQHVARRWNAATTDPQRRTELQAVYTPPAYYGRMPSPLGWLKPVKNQIAVQRLWQLIPQCYPEDPTDWQLARLRHLIGLPVEQAWSDEHRLDSARQIAERATQLGGEELPGRLRAVAFALMRVREWDEARELLKTAVKLNDIVDSIWPIADSLAAEEKWGEAAEWYHRAAEKVPQDAFFEFAEGWCRRESEDTTDEDTVGEDLMNRACLSFLAKTSDRFRSLDLRVNDRSWSGARHWLSQLTLRTAEYGNVYTMNAAGTLGNTVSKTQPRLAVKMWERLQLGLTAPGTYVSEYEQILVSQETLQRVKGRDLAKRGRIPELLKAIETARSTIPGSELIALEFVPTLRESGREAEADRLLDQIATVNRQVLERYPNSHRHHYRLARLSAELEWRTEDGLQHAQAAVDLVPGNPAYRKILAKLNGESVDEPTGDE